MGVLSRFIVPAGLVLAGMAGPAGAQEAPAPLADDRGAQVSVAPLRLELAGAETAAVLRVTNPSGREIGVQVRTFGWTQKDGQDSYFSTNDVMISPSIIQIAPGQTQIFRVVRRDPASPGEKRYRVAVDQLPDPALEQAGEAQARIRFTLPLFLDRDQAAPAAVVWTVDREGLHASNAGEQTVRILGVSLATSDGTELPLERNSLRYLQGKSSIVWPLTGTCPTAPVAVRAQIDGGTVNAQADPHCD